MEVLELPLADAHPLVVEAVERARAPPAAAQGDRGPRTASSPFS